MNSNLEFWKKHWVETSKSDNMFVQMGKSSYTAVDFFLTIDDIVRYMKFNETDTLLDAGGGAGWVSLSIAPYVKEAFVFDYSEELVEKAKVNILNFHNIQAYVDDLLLFKNTKACKFSKIIVGSVLQYFDNYEQIERIFQNLYAALSSGGKAILTLNPDFDLKSAHIASYERLNWDKDRILKSLEIEEKRMWLKVERLDEIASKIGFSKFYTTPISQNLWHSTHMFNYMLEK